MLFAEKKFLGSEPVPLYRPPVRWKKPSFGFFSKIVFIFPKMGNSNKINLDDFLKIKNGQVYGNLILAFLFDFYDFIFQGKLISLRFAFS